MSLENKIFSWVKRNENGDLYSISINWPPPEPCISYFRPDLGPLGTWFYKGMSDSDYVKTFPGDVHPMDCFRQVRNKLTLEEQIKYIYRQDLINLKNTLFLKAEMILVRGQT